MVNWAGCCLAFFLKAPKSAGMPCMASLELWNECNANCLFCRSEKGEIYDIDPKALNSPIPKGKMPLPMALDIICQLKKHLLICVLYTNGEPLIYEDLPQLVRFATQNRLATMIATNGLLLDETRGRALLKAGLDFVKIQLSGFTQEIYNIQVRQGNVEKLKNNIINFVRMNREGGNKTIILIDYILYGYNRHQLPLVEKFCEELGLTLSLRPGNPSHGLEDKEPPLVEEKTPLSISCDWLWKAMQINWNGDILPCCESVVFGSTEAYERFCPGKTNLKEVWNGAKAAAMRSQMTKKGRKGIPLCSECLRKGLSFKW